MGMKIKDSAVFQLSGIGRIQVWKRGVIGPLLEEGLTLAEAQRIAMRFQAKKFTMKSNNIVMNVGKNLVAQLITGDETVGFTYHAIGTFVGFESQYLTTLATEAARKAITQESLTDNEITLSTFYLASESSYAIKEAGIFGGSTASGTANSGVLFSRYLVDYDNSGGLSDLTFDYVIPIGGPYGAPPD